MENDVRQRFHDVSADLQAVMARVGAVEQQQGFFAQQLEDKASTADVQLVLDRLDHLRQNFAEVKNVVWGFIGVVLIALIGAAMTALLQHPPHP